MHPKDFMVYSIVQSSDSLDTSEDRNSIAKQQHSEEDWRNRCQKEGAMQTRQDFEYVKRERVRKGCAYFC